MNFVFGLILARTLQIYYKNEVEKKIHLEFI